MSSFVQPGWQEAQACTLVKVGGLTLCVEEHVWDLSEPEAVQVTKGFVKEDGSLSLLTCFH